VARAVADDPARFTASEITGAPRIGVLTAPFAGQVGPVVRDHFHQVLRRLAGGRHRSRGFCPVDLSLLHAAHRVITSGAIHLLNGLYDAKLDHAPVLAVTGMQETSVLRTGYQQEVHTDRLYAEVAEYNLVVDNRPDVPGPRQLSANRLVTPAGPAGIARRQPGSAQA
jgi:glyoxylate carboligase